ncbi:hypothetical protein [Wukongibacter baidiensis]
MKGNKDRILIIAIFMIISGVSVFRNLEGKAIVIIAFLMILPFMRYISGVVYKFTVGDQYKIELDIEQLYKDCEWDIKVAVKRIDKYYLQDISLEILASRLNRLKHDSDIVKNTIIGVMSGCMVAIMTDARLREIIKKYSENLSNENLLITLILWALYLILGIMIALIFLLIYLSVRWIFLRPDKNEVVKKYLQEYEVGIIESKIKEVIES